VARVLVAEDDAFSRRFLAKSIERWGYDVVLASDGDEAWAILQREDAPPLALVDWMMPGLDGLELCRRVRELKKDRSTYLIILTANEDMAHLVDAMNAGADDFVTKKYDVRELKVRLRAGRRIVEVERALWDLATRDPLTQLWNHGAILEVLDRELARASRMGTSLGVVMADVDHFKRINDSFGHKAGDAALAQLSERLVCDLRQYDTIGRYGGEEFLIVLPAPAASGAATVAQRLRQTIAAQPFDLEGVVTPITMSFGVAVTAQPQALGAGALVKCADEALYRAKESGRNRVVVSDAEPEQCNTQAA